MITGGKERGRERERSVREDARTFVCLSRYLQKRARYKGHIECDVASCYDHFLLVNVEYRNEKEYLKLERCGERSIDFSNFFYLSIIFIYYFYKLSYILT